MSEIICRLAEELVRKEHLDAFPQRVTKATSLDTEVALRIETFSSAARAAAEVPCQHYDYPPDVEIFLQPSSKVECANEEIKALAADLSLGCDGVVSLAKRFSAWIDAHIQYDEEHSFRINSGAEPFSALKCLHRSKGTCGEKAHLLAALLRARDVPARFIHGVIMPAEHSGMVQAHAWVEVYLHEHGWLPVDPRGNSGDGNEDYLTSTNYVKLYAGRDFSDIGVKLTDLRGIKIDWA